MRTFVRATMALALLIIAACGAPEAEDVSIGETDFVTGELVTPAPVHIKSYDLATLQVGYYLNNYLVWKSPNIFRYSGGSQLSAVYKYYDPINGIPATRVDDPTGEFKGWCVSFVKSLANRTVGTTSTWRPGAKVMNGGVQIGQAVATFGGTGATFRGGDPPNDHVGFFGGYVPGGFILYDENGDGKKRVMRHNANSPYNYYVLLSP